MLIVPSLLSDKPLLEKEEPNLLLIIPVLVNAEKLLKVEIENGATMDMRARRVVVDAIKIFRKFS